MNRLTPLLLRATIFILVAAVLVTVAAIGRYALFDERTTPRTETERAMILAVQAVKTDPNDAKARLKLASVYLELGRTSAALSQAKIAARIAPKDPDVFYVLGLANEQRGNTKEAIKNLEKAAKTTGELGPFYQACWLELAKIHMSQKNYKSAIKAYDMTLGYGPESASTLYDIARAYELNGEVATATAYYKEVLEFVPDDRNALLALERLKKENSTRNKSTNPEAKTEGK